MLFRFLFVASLNGGKTEDTPTSPDGVVVTPYSMRLMRDWSTDQRVSPRFAEKVARRVRRMRRRQHTTAPACIMVYDLMDRDEQHRPKVVDIIEIAA